MLTMRNIAFMLVVGVYAFIRPAAVAADSCAVSCSDCYVNYYACQTCGTGTGTSACDAWGNGCALMCFGCNGGRSCIEYP